MCDTIECDYHDGKDCVMKVWSQPTKCWRTPREVFQGMCPMQLRTGVKRGR